MTFIFFFYSCLVRTCFLLFMCVFFVYIYTHTHTHTHIYIYIYIYMYILVDKFAYLGSSVSLTETDIDTRLAKAWTAIDRLSVIWKSDLTDKMKCSFFQSAAMSILLYGCNTQTLTKRMKKKLDGNYTKTLAAPHKAAAVWPPTTHHENYQN